ncbi:MAG: hypothetical protein RLY86_3534 [Pseudomonadota bacterium]|jgi:hypothetical protein
MAVAHTIKGVVPGRTQEPASPHESLNVDAAVSRARDYHGFLSGLSPENRRKAFSFDGMEVAGKAGMADR